MAASHNVMSNNNFSFKALIKNSWIAWGYPRYLLLQAYGPRSWPGQGACNGCPPLTEERLSVPQCDTSS